VVENRLDLIEKGRGDERDMNAGIHVLAALDFHEAHVERIAERGRKLVLTENRRSVTF